MPAGSMVNSSAPTRPPQHPPQHPQNDPSPHIVLAFSMVHTMAPVAGPSASWLWLPPKLSFTSSPRGANSRDKWALFSLHVLLWGGGGEQGVAWGVMQAGRQAGRGLGGARQAAVGSRSLAEGDEGQNQHGWTPGVNDAAEHQHLRHQGLAT